MTDIVVHRPYSAPGGLTQAYATAEEFRARVGSAAAGDDATISEQLTTVSRYLERRLGGAEGPRFYNREPSPTVRLYDGNGRRILPVQDVAMSAGLTVKVDLDRDSVCEEELALDAHFRLRPLNADKGPEAAPWQYLELIDWNAVLRHWPEWPASVQVTAVHGWPAVPGAIKETTISITRQLRDIHQGGAAFSEQDINQVIRVTPNLTALFMDLMDKYGRKRTWFV
jgi:hypothetical protein